MSVWMLPAITVKEATGLNISPFTPPPPPLLPHSFLITLQAIVYVTKATSWYVNIGENRNCLQEGEVQMIAFIPSPTPIHTKFVDLKLLCVMCNKCMMIRTFWEFLLEITQWPVFSTTIYYCPCELPPPPPPTGSATASTRGSASASGQSLHPGG